MEFNFNCYYPLFCFLEFGISNIIFRIFQVFRFATPSVVVLVLEWEHF